MLKNSILLLLIFSLTPTFANGQFIHHQLSVTAEPQHQYVSVTDSITIPADQVKMDLHFLLANDLTVESKTTGVTIALEESKIPAKDVGMDQESFDDSANILMNKYAITFFKNTDVSVAFILKYSGKLYYPIKKISEEYARSFSQTPGIISKNGVYLAGSTYWVPKFNDQLITFELTTSLPESWDVV
ncbi:MAG: hypothetical protein ACTSYF_12840, partial [Promethearchaeota archaeon]